jgi:hypothetical protein
MDNVGEAIAAINDLKREGVVSEYALGGAIAIIFWSEPVATFDLDVFVLQEQTGPLVSLSPIYKWAAERGYEEQAEHIVIAGVPVQIIPAHNELASEAVAEAVEMDYAGVPVRVIRPEYLVALYLEGSARTRKRLERVEGLLEAGSVDESKLQPLLDRFKLRLPREKQ